MTPSPVFDPWSLTRIYNLNNLFGWTALALLSSLVLVVCGRRRKGATKVSNHTLFSQNTMLEETLPVKTAPPPGHVVVSKILIHPIKVGKFNLSSVFVTLCFLLFHGVIMY